MDVSMTPKPIYFYVWRHRDIPNISRNNPESFLNSCWKFQSLKIVNFVSIGKRQGPKKPEDPSNSFSKIVHVISVSSKQHETQIWQYGINILKNKKHEAGILQLRVSMLDGGLDFQASKNPTFHNFGIVACRVAMF